MTIKPEELLSKSIGKRIKLVLKNGEEYDGLLKNFDEYLNLIIETEKDVLVFKGSEINLIIFP
jgi:small nuclear ribonucleoprotein (snRNP)-like protein